MVPNVKSIGSRIVASWPGSGTAETIYQTEDGRAWLHNPCVEPARLDRTASGSGIGHIIGGHIFEAP